MILLFLDFDGVLHPALNYRRNNFCQLPIFEAVMREHHEVSIIISSSWRHIYSLAELKAFFSADIAERINGMTGNSNGKQRYVEITHYLEQHVVEGTPWLVLDDNVFGFPSRWTNLVLCDSRIGLTPITAGALHEKICMARMGYDVTDPRGVGNDGRRTLRTCRQS